jgi:hypothetical protein
MNYVESNPRPDILNRGGAEAQRKNVAPQRHCVHGAVICALCAPFFLIRDFRASVVNLFNMPLRLCASAVHSQIAHDSVLVRGG